MDVTYIDRVTEMPNKSIPDFGWPYRISGLLFEFLKAQGQEMRVRLAVLQRRFPLLAVAASWSCISYIGVLWICLCYIQFPVSPYSLSDVAEWLAIVAAITFGTIYAVYCGGAVLVLLLFLLSSIGILLTLSLGYLCWVLMRAVRKRSLWLTTYRPVILAGALISLALGTCLDGEYRFWDRPFEVTHWVKYVVAAESAWAALFCYFSRGGVTEPSRPRTVVMWTVGLATAIGLLGSWHANTKREQYFLSKEIVDHPTDANAWLHLAWHYSQRGDLLAADSEDENRPQGNIDSLYKEALGCFDHAVSLGAGGFDIHLARAHLADALGETQEAVSSGREALNLALISEGPPTTGKHRDEIMWLQEMLGRNAEVTGETAVLEERKRVRDQRRSHLPSLVRWAFEIY